MGKPFSTTMRRYEIISGIIWLILYVTLMSDALKLALGYLGISVGAVTLNKIYFIACFVITVVLFRRFLAYSLPPAVESPLRFVMGILLGFCIYEGCQVAISIIYDLFLPNLWIPGDDSVRELAVADYRVMWVGAVLLAPFTEETLVRGLVFGNLRKKNRLAAYVAAALVFGIIHVIGYIPQMDILTLLLNLLLYAVPSAAMCAAYEYGGTIWTPIALHMIINLLAMYGVRG